jgi:hypothetical protein
MTAEQFLGRKTEASAWEQAEARRANFFELCGLFFVSEIKTEACHLGPFVYNIVRVLERSVNQ